MIFGFEVVYNLLIAVHDERKENKKYECYLCSKLFSQETTLESHISTAHASNIHQKCENCQKSFSSPIILKRHIKKRQCKDTVNEGQKSTKCKSCGKSSATIYYSKEHIGAIHEEHKINKCDICDKTFPSLVHCRKHNLIFHNNSEIKTDQNMAKKKKYFGNNGRKMEEIITDEQQWIVESEINSILNNLTEENIEDMETKYSRINSQLVEIIMVCEGGKSYFQYILKAPNTVTLSDTKNDDEKYKYYVKTLEEGLEFFEFCDDDFKILPMIENKIILKCYS